jgi:5'(3')-deoxyribonucleotidase
MKSSEVVNNKTIAEAPIFSTGRPEVFLDMDGVVADFFGEYAKMAKAENYRTIPGELRGPVLDKMIGSDFFYRLPKFPTADKLVDMLTKTFGHYNICSSPLRGDHENSDQMKRAWIKENLNPQPKRIVITPNKPQMAPAVQEDGTPNILIDDRNTNITQWEQAGGLGIKYQADEDGLDVVVNGIKRAFEVIYVDNVNTNHKTSSVKTMVVILLLQMINKMWRKTAPKQVGLMTQIKLHYRIF